MADDDVIAAAIIACLGARATTASICPSEAARSVHADETGWRQLMPQVRRVAAGMVQAQTLIATQGERVLASSDVLMADGPIRLRRGGLFPLER